MLFGDQPSHDDVYAGLPVHCVLSEEDLVESPPPLTRGRSPGSSRRASGAMSSPTAS